MSKSISAIVVLCVFFCFQASARHSAAGDEEPERAGAQIQPSAAESTSDFRERFEREIGKVVTISFEESTIAEVVAYLKTQMDIPVLIDRNHVGISADATKLSGQFFEMSIRSVLNHLLRQLELTWLPRDGALLITTPEEAEDELLIEIYPVVDLVRFDWAVGPASYDYDSLIDLITSIVAPQAWPTASGPGPIDPFRGTITVPQSYEVQQEIRGLLAALRKAKQMIRTCGRSAPPVVSIGREESPATQRIHSALPKEIAWELTDGPLADLVDRLRENYRINIMVDRGAFDDAALDPDHVTVSLEGEGIPLEDALRRALGRLDLAWIVQDEALVVTTAQEAECHREIRVYPILDLIGPVVDRGEFAFSYYESNPGDLVYLVGHSVGAATWDWGGGPGSIDTLPMVPALVISHTAEMHRQVEDFLTKLRAAVDQASKEEQAAKANQRSVSDTTGADKDKLRFVVYFVASPSVERGAGNDAHTSGNSDAADGRPNNNARLRMGGLGMWDSPPPVPEQELLQVVKELVASESWTKGEGVYARAVPGRLIIRHTEAVHQSIDNLLRRLGVLTYGDLGMGY